MYLTAANVREALFILLDFPDGNQRERQTLCGI